MRKNNLQLIVIGIFIAAAARGAALPPADTTALTRSFNEEFKDDFEFVSSHDVRDEFDLPWCMVEVRPKKAGFFVIRYEADVDPKRDTQKRTHVCYEYFISIGEAGAPRLIEEDARRMHPLANVGDTLVVPIDCKSQLSGLRFYNTAAEARVAKIWQDYEQHAADDIRRGFSGKAKLELNNEVADSLPLVGLVSGSAGTAGGGFTMRSTEALFEAKTPGEFNFRPSANGRSGESLAIKIVAKTEPISAIALLANQFDTDKYGTSESVDETVSRKPTGTVVMRVGDQLQRALSGQMEPKGTPATQPLLRIEKLPFAAQAWPFDFMGK